MKFTHAFAHIDSSQALMTYAEEKMTKLRKWEIKPSMVHFVYSMQRHECRVEIQVVGGVSDFLAHSECKDWHMAVDQAVQKLARQMQKHKARLKGHKNPQQSRHGQLLLLTPRMEMRRQNPPVEPQEQIFAEDAAEQGKRR